LLIGGFGNFGAAISSDLVFQLVGEAQYGKDELATGFALQDRASRHQAAQFCISYLGLRQKRSKARQADDNGCQLVSSAAQANQSITGQRPIVHTRRINHSS
jgi:hypothetical protein